MATTNLKRSRTTVRTHEGAPAKRIGSEAQLRRTVMSCLLWEDEFYEDGVSIADRIAAGVDAVSQEEAATIAIEAREQMHLRHAPLWVVRHMAKRGGKIVGDTLARVIQRADELSEFVSLYWKDGKTPLSAQVKRGLALAFTKFNEYALAKYDRERDVRLRDVLFLSHPKPKDEEQAALWKRLVDGTMATPNTWETRLSSGEDKKAVWLDLMAEQALGGLAFLRNLRNMQQVGVPDPSIRKSMAGVNFSRVLPFRFIAAAKHAPSLEPDLEAAMFRACDEMEKLPGKTTLLVDHSGSMDAALSSKSDLKRFDAACGLAMLIREVCEEAEIVAFSTWAALVPPRRGFALRDAIHNAGPWGGTYTEAAKRAVDERSYDRIIIITDEQSHQALSDPKGKGYVVNVASAKNGIGYGAWTHIDGWSESVVRYIQEAERVPC